jgi:hypothetical protein
MTREEKRNIHYITCEPETFREISHIRQLEIRDYISLRSTGRVLKYYTIFFHY